MLSNVEEETICDHMEDVFEDLMELYESKIRSGMLGVEEDPIKAYLFNDLNLLYVQILASTLYIKSSM